MKNRKRVKQEPKAAPQPISTDGGPEAVPSAPCDTCKPLRELKAEAKELKIRYFSRLKREELEEAMQCAREQGKGDAARLKELEKTGKERSDALWAAWRKKQEQAG